MKTNQALHPTIDPAACTVDSICGSGGTGVAIYLHDTGECWVLCQGDGSFIPFVERPRLSLDARVSVEAKEVDRARLGEFMANFCDTELFIPAAEASEKVTLAMQDTTLGAAIEWAGLVAGWPASIK